MKETNNNKKIKKQTILQFSYSSNAKLLELNIFPFEEEKQIFRHRAVVRPQQLEEAFCGGEKGEKKQHLI